NTFFSNNTSQKNITFNNLLAGRLYTITVTSVSGPFSSTSDVNTTATQPNPPGPIQISKKTNTSISITWPHPLLMEGAPNISFSITYRPKDSEVFFNSTTDRNITELSNLTSGTEYNLSVETVGPLSLTSPKVYVSSYTLPNPVQNLQASTVNISAVRLEWGSPAGVKNFYKYFVQISNNSGFLLNMTVQTNNTGISDLEPGTQYNCTVSTVASEDAVSSPESTLCSTQPKMVNGLTAVAVNTTAMTLTWAKQSDYKGTYSYLVHYGIKSKEKNITTMNEKALISDLIQGTNYTFWVTTVANGIQSDQAITSNYTKPERVYLNVSNGGTNDSITATWGSPHGNVEAYEVILSSSYNDHRNKTLPSGNQLYTFSNLRAGRIYEVRVFSISGPFAEDSGPTSNATYPNRPGPIRVLSNTVNSIHLNWTAAPDMDSGSFNYSVLYNSTRNGSNITSYNSITLDGLDSGTLYSFNVATVGQLELTSKPVSLSTATDAHPVSDLICTGENLSPKLKLTWKMPHGSNEGFNISWGNDVSSQAQTKSCNYTITDLSYYKNYTVSIWTIGCGKPSSVVQTTCQTGITCPPKPDINMGINTNITKMEYNMFALKFSTNLLNSENGPIVAYGILVTSGDEGVPANSSYLNNTWTKDQKTPYLALIQNNTVQTRNGENTITVDVGSGSKSAGYINGPLTAKTTYRFALALFTHLELDNNTNLVKTSESYVTFSDFYTNAIRLPENPAVIGGAVSGTLAFLVILICITVILTIHWRRIARKDSADIPIQSMSIPIRVEDYEAYYKKQRADSNCGFAEEFEDLKPVGVSQAKVSALALENKGKNRYSNVLPYDSSRVKLSINGSPFDDYINASYMPGYNSKKEYIAAQGPLPATVNEFWRMIWEKNVHTLVMLTRCNEQGRVKCEEYWPSKTKHFNNITVTTTSEIPLEDWTIRDFDIKNVKTAETRALRHFHFTAWPDHGVPETTELLINFRHLVREHMEQFSRNSPTVVHCSAGVGRTGTFIAIDRLIYQIERESLVDVYGIVHDLRMHRPLMVQTEDQYVFLNQCAMDIIKSRTGTNVDLIYQNTAALTIYENVQPMKGGNGYPEA
ncbi:hypothetical protein MATL_G00099630, partial [Megalops atlanticus]